VLLCQYAPVVATGLSCRSLQFQRYSRALAQKQEIIVANKIDLDPDGKIVKELKKKLNKKIYPISAVTGDGIKELSELLWQTVKEVKS